MNLTTKVYIYGLYEGGICIYVGKTIDLRRRLREHCKSMKRDLTISVLSTCTRKTWRRVERRLISEMKLSNPNLLNIQNGGEGPSNDIWLTPEQRAARSRSATKQWTPERRRSVSSQAKAYWATHRAELVRKIKSAVNTAEHRAALSRAIKKSWEGADERRAAHSRSMKAMRSR